MLKIGTQAPDFTVTLGSSERFTLSEHRGRNVVIYFYPRAFSPACKIQTKRFGKAHDEFAALNAIVVGISGDGVDTLASFGDACETPFGLGSDPSGEIRRLYDVKRQLGLGTSRITYVIDSEGVIRGAFHNEILMARHTSNALRVLLGLQ